MTSGGSPLRPEEGTKADESCTICSDVFRDPRLLPCQHTFCSDCLEKWHCTSGRKQCLSCPICRETVWLPRQGIRALCSNYFVPSQTTTERCNTCKSSTSGVCRCVVCDKWICRACRTTHGTDTAAEDNLCSSSEILPEDTTGMVTAISSLRSVTRSCCYAEVMFGFQCKTGNGNTCIKKIVPISETEAWILLNNVPDIYKYNVSGRVTETRCGTGRVLDICVHPDGPLLAIEEDSNSVLICGDAITSPIEYVNLGNYLPTSLVMREDGYLVVAVRAVHEMEKRNDACFLLTFNEERTLLQSKILNPKRAFQRIIALAWDRTCHRICTCDQDSRLVHMLTDYTLALSYRRSPVFPVRSDSGRIRSYTFCPKSVCSGLGGCYYVLDTGSGYIHVLNGNARLTGVVITDDPEQDAAPGTIATGPDGNLWVGDGMNGRVNVYNLSSFINYLEPFTPALDHPLLHGGEMVEIESNCEDEHNEITADYSHQTEAGPVGYSLTQHEVIALGRDGQPHSIMPDMREALAVQHPGAQSISVIGGIHGSTILLKDFGSPQANSMARENAMRLLQEDPAIRNRMVHHGINVDALGPDDFRFDVTSGNLPAANCLTGNRDVDREFLNRFMSLNPEIRQDMDSHGVTSEHILNFRQDQDVAFDTFRLNNPG